MFKCHICQIELTSGSFVDQVITCNKCEKDMMKCRNCNNDLFSKTNLKCIGCNFTYPTIKCDDCGKQVSDGVLQNGLLMCKSCVSVRFEASKKIQICPKCDIRSLMYKSDQLNNETWYKCIICRYEIENSYISW